MMAFIGFLVATGFSKRTTCWALGFNGCCYQNEQCHNTVHFKEITRK